MRLKSEELAPEQRALLTPEYLANESGYWAIYDDLLREHRGEWVGVMGGKVVLVASSLMEAMRKARELGRGIYVDRVGHEFDTQFRLRRSEFTYDPEYVPPIPRAKVVFANGSKSRRATFEDVIPDTGADLSWLPPKDCAELDLQSGSDPSMMSVSGAGPDRVSIVFLAHASVGGREHEALIEPNPYSSERVLGREVLNDFAAVTFRGKEGKVVFEE